MNDESALQAGLCTNPWHQFGRTPGTASNKPARCASGACQWPEQVEGGAKPQLPPCFLSMFDSRMDEGSEEEADTYFPNRTSHHDGITDNCDAEGFEDIRAAALAGDRSVTVLCHTH